MSRRVAILIACLALGAGAWLYWGREEVSRVDQLRAIVKREPKNVQARVELAGLLLDAAERDARQTAEEDEKYLQMQDAKMPAAGALFKKIAAQRANSLAAVREASVAAGQALQIAPERLDVCLVAARSCIATEQWKELRALTEAFRGKFPAAGGVKLREASILASIGMRDMGEAEDEAHRLLAADKGNVLATVVLGRADLIRRAYPEADAKIAVMKTREMSSDPFVLESYGILLRDRNQVAESLPILERAVAFGPDHTRFRYALAQAYRRLGREADAIHQHRMIWRLNKDDPYVYVAQAQSFHAMKNDVKAREYLGIAATLAKEDPQILALNARLLSSTDDKGVRDLVLAADYAERASKATHDEDLELLRLEAKINADLGQATANDKRFDLALQIAGRAMALAERNGQTGVANEIRNEISDYAARRQLVPQEPEELGPMPMPGAPGTQPQKPLVPSASAPT